MPKLNVVDGTAVDVNCNYRFKNDVFQIKNVTDGKWHTIWIETEGGQAKFKVAINGEA